MNQKKLERAKQFQQQQGQHHQEHQQEDHEAHHPEQYHDVKEYLSWRAPGRPFKPRSREFFVNAILIAVAVEIILFLFSQYMLMVAVFSFVFLSFALASVPPREFAYKISSEGILIEDQFFIWEELYDFFFFKQHGADVLIVRTKPYFPGELTITLGDIPAKQIKSVLLHHLPFREHVEPTYLEKAGDWLERTFPLEKSAR